MHPRFPLNTSESELLIAFLEGQDVQAAARRLGKDPTIVSRLIQGIQARFALFEKREKKWRLSDSGLAVAELVKSQATDLARRLDEKSVLTIATTPEFATRVLPDFFRETAAKIRYEVVASHTSVEKHLLRGRADFGIECGRPESPLIRFRQIAPEALAIAYPRGWGKLGAKALVASRPYLEFIRLPAHEVLRLSENLPEIQFRSNSVGLLRSLATAGRGWTIVPRYAIRAELERGELRALAVEPSRAERFGIWWSIHRPLPPAVLADFSAKLRAVKLA